MNRIAWRRAVVVFAALALVPTAWARVPAAPVAQSHERFVAIDGVRNFRDVGGYRTTSGRTVRWGMLCRAGALGGMTPRGKADFARLGVVSIIDVRSAEERRQVPEDWLGGPKLSYWTHDYTRGGGADPARPMSRPTTPEAVRQLMYGAYGSFPKQMAPSYRELFVRLTASRGPLVLNCTAGKDRTGIGTALVLHALGVPYPTIREDFLLSNRGINPAALRPSLPPELAALSDEALLPLAGVEGGYLDAAFAQLTKEYGSIEGYLQKELGIGPREIARLRRRMLT
jgi:protein-tyrosine phosphatase